MKKVLFSLLLVASVLAAGTTAKAQSNSPVIKIGIFDIDRMVQAMPGYGKVDTAVALYERDSLAAEYEFYNSEYHRLDSTFKADSAKGKPKSVLDAIGQQRQQVGMNIVYWQQIAQNKSQNKRAQLAQPLYETVANSYKKILEAKKITLVLKPEAIEMGSSPTILEDLFVLVAKDLKIPLGQGQNAAGAVEDDEPKQAAPAKPQGGGTGTKPKPKQ